MCYQRIIYGQIGLSLYIYQSPINFFGLPVDDTGQNERQAIGGNVVLPNPGGLA